MGNTVVKAGFSLYSYCDHLVQIKPDSVETSPAHTTVSPTFAPMTNDHFSSGRLYNIASHPLRKKNRKFPIAYG